MLRRVLGNLQRQAEALAKSLRELMHHLRRDVPSKVYGAFAAGVLASFSMGVGGKLADSRR